MSERKKILKNVTLKINWEEISNQKINAAHAEEASERQKKSSTTGEHKQITNSTSITAVTKTKSVNAQQDSQHITLILHTTKPTRLQRTTPREL